MKFTCEDLVRYLSDYLDNELDEALVSAAQEHLATCHNCRVVLDSTQKTIRLYKDQGSFVQIPSGRKNALYEQIAAAYHGRESGAE